MNNISLVEDEALQHAGATMTEQVAASPDGPSVPAETRRHVALPITRRGRQLGVLFFDGDVDDLPGLSDRTVLDAVTHHIEAALNLAKRPPRSDALQGNGQRQDVLPLRIRRFARNDVIFLDGKYLIKGLAGTIFWKLVRDYHDHGRTEFSNLELRLDLAMKYPERAENLESRLVMLIRRLDGIPHLRVERISRGRFRLVVDRPLELQEEH